MTPRDKAIRTAHDEILRDCDYCEPGKPCWITEQLQDLYEAGFAAAIERAARYLEVEHMFFDYAEDVRALKEPKP